MSVASAAMPEDDDQQPPQEDLPLAIPAAGQLSFFSAEEEQEVIKGLSTGEGLYRRDPVLYRMVVRLLGQDAPIREIKRLTGLHHRTIQAVREREGGTIDTLRKALGAKALQTASLVVESIEQMIVDGNVKAGEAGLLFNFLVDKGQVLTGGVTSRTESIVTESVQDKLQAALDAMPVLQVERVTGSANTGIPAGKMSAMGGLDPEGNVGPETGEDDLQSTARQSETSHDATFEATSSENSGPDSLEKDPGGEGGAADGGAMK